MDYISEQWSFGASKNLSEQLFFRIKTFGNWKKEICPNFLFKWVKIVSPMDECDVKSEFLMDGCSLTSSDNTWENIWSSRGGHQAAISWNWKLLKGLVNIDIHISQIHLVFGWPFRVTVLKDFDYLCPLLNGTSLPHHRPSNTSL